MCQKENPRDKLLSSMKDTVRARFKAHKRLTKLDQNLTAITALSSSLVIILTVMPYIFKSPGQIADIINFIAVLVSVVILVASLLQYSNQNATTAEQHHRCALEINELIRAHNIKEQPSNDEFAQLEKSYGLLLQKYSINHDEIDYHQVLIERRHEHPWLKEDTIKSYEREAWLENWSVRGWIIVLAILLVVSFALAVIGPKLLHNTQKKVECSTVEHIPRP